MSTLPSGIRLPSVPPMSQVWRTFSFWTWIFCIWLLLAAVPGLITRYWFLDSMGRGIVFRVNFTAQTLLFLAGLALFSAAVIVPVRAYAVSDTLRRAAVDAGLWVGLFAGWQWSMHFLEYLLAANGGAFGETDPVFGRDIGFYIFLVPAVETTRLMLMWLAAIAVAASIIGRFDQLRSHGAFRDPATALRAKASLLVTNGLNAAMFLLGLTLVARTFLARYGLLVKDNGDTGVRAGAAYLDVTGLFSTLNWINVSVFVELGIMAVAGYSMHRMKRDSEATGAGIRHFRLRLPTLAAAALLTLDLGFYVGLVARNSLLVKPNEPTVQLPYIQRHMDATLRGYRLKEIETVDWRPPKEPLSAGRILQSRTVANTPLLTPWVSRLEEPPDVQHYERVKASGSTHVYGPMLKVFEQEQQLRPYYRFLSVDSVRYRVNGEKRMFASAARELPSIGFAGPKQWLRHWGSGALMYTHGFGLVMSPAHEINSQGGPRYAAGGLPPTPSDPVLSSEPRIYFGEGAKDAYILTGIRHLKELDHATPQSRMETVFRPDVDRGIPVDSVFKRVILALQTGDINEFLFSGFIDPNKTRAQFNRTPIQRISTIAPFLFLDTNVYAFAAEGRTLWMINGLTTTDRYPYSFREVLGDKADERAVERFPERVVNYAEDSVKVTIDAYSGDVRFYKIADDPIVNAWERVYPGLFEAKPAMPEAVEAQLSYPLQWFHIQFDDIYKRYHQRNPLEFYNVEDLWDDADEVLGSIGRGLTEFGTKDQMTFSYEGSNLLVDPADLPAGALHAKPGELQFAMLMPFTPEGARNLRSLVVAFQDPGNYGKLLNLRVPQGEFIPGPEQADTLIDNDSQVNQQITLWVRHGSEVIRGHTVLLPVGGDLMYVEPLWISSLQNELPEVKLISVVYRGRTTMGLTLEQAIRLLGRPEAEEQEANELPWFKDAHVPGSK